jgi:group I intron endonuclease
VDSGIYKIINKINNKIYIGSALSINIRWQHHISELKYNRHPNRYLQRAWNKYGSENFKFEIIEIVNTEKDCIIREQFYLDTLLKANINDKTFNKLGYNIIRIAGSNLGRKSTNETKQKISKSLIGHKRNKGRIQSEETKIKIKDKKKDTTITKIISRKHQGNIPVTKYNINGEKICIYISLTEAAYINNINISNISSCCNGTRKSTGGYIWKYNQDKKLSINDPVMQFDLNGLFIREYNSIKEAAKVLQFNTKNITRCIQGKRDTAGGYLWKLA